MTGDLTSALHFLKVDSSAPSLPQPSAVDSRVTMSSCAASAPLDLATDGTTTLKVLEQTVGARVSGHRELGAGASGGRHAAEA